MKIDVHISPLFVKETALAGAGVIVIDILRAGTTICQALVNGCRRIIPVATIDHAKTFSGLLPRNSIMLCGEREGKKIPGFDLGNSPFEYTPKKIGGKTIILTTTNGTVALDMARRARETVVGGFVNFSCILERAIHWDSDIAIICSGCEGMMSLEDMVAGGMFACHLRGHFGKHAKINDTARAAEMLYHSFSDSLVDLVQTAAHGKYLQSIGFGDDLPFCAQVDSLPVMPVFKEGSILAAAKKKRKVK